MYVQLALFGEWVVRLVLPFERAGVGGAWQTRRVVNEEARDLEAVTSRRVVRWSIVMVCASVGTLLGAAAVKGDLGLLISVLCLAVNTFAVFQIIRVAWSQARRQAGLDTR